MANKTEDKQADKKVSPSKVGSVESDQRVENRLNADETNTGLSAKEMEKQIDRPDSNVTVHTPEEIEKRQAKATDESRAASVDQTNSGLDNSTRPGGDEGNGLTYKDERIQPSDTNAPDAGLLPDGTRIAS